MGRADREIWNKNKAKSQNGGIQESGRSFSLDAMMKSFFNVQEINWKYNYEDERAQ